ncbi:MAG: PID-CTERM protein-sorting domain-containing protein [Chitinophagaceae bacterium]
MKKFLYLLLVAIAVTTVAVAQSDPDGFDEVNQQMDAPIDGGVTLLLAGTAAYGIKRMRNKQQHKK